MPVLNEFSTIKVGKTWKFILKYVLPILLIVVWIFGVANLIKDGNTFKIIVDVIIVLLVVGLSLLFTKMKPESQ